MPSELISSDVVGWNCQDESGPIGVRRLTLRQLSHGLSKIDKYKTIEGLKDTYSS